MSRPIKQFFIHNTLNDAAPPHTYTSVDDFKTARKVAMNLVRDRLYVKVFITKFEDGKPCGMVWERAGK